MSLTLIISSALFVVLFITHTIRFLFYRKMRLVKFRDDRYGARTRNFFGQYVFMNICDNHDYRLYSLQNNKISFGTKNNVIDSISLWDNRHRDLGTDFGEPVIKAMCHPDTDNDPPKSP